jgi:type I restriction enzyme S subunit
MWKIKVQLPPTIKEQERIGDALDDVDQLIECLEGMITKKRCVALGARQVLVSGRRRLPGYSGEWPVQRLGEVLRVRHGKSQHAIVDGGGSYPILASGGEIGRTNHWLSKGPSVLIGRKGTIDQPQFIDTPFWTIDTLFWTEIGDSADVKFIYYLFWQIPWRSYNEASGVPSLNASTIEAIEVAVPPTIEEQYAIADFLSDMDAEIEVLENRLAKTRDLKQGMAQELLSGRTRLV